jgi:glycosyltransferase involved in cell wall biosynthesis
MSSRKPRVVYWNNIPSPQFVRRMNSVDADGAIDIEAWFNTEREPIRSWTVDPSSWTFRYRYLGANPLVRVLRASSMLIRSRPDVFFTLYGDLAYAVVTLLAWAIRIPVVIHAQHQFGTWAPRRKYAEVGKRVLFRLATGTHVSGPDSVAYVTQYAPSTPSYVIQEDVDVEFWRSTTSDLAASRGAFRREHGLHGCVFIYVGRLWHGKGVAILLDAYRELVRDSLDVSLVLAGDGVDEDELRRRASDLPRVTFAGFREGRELAAWYSASDVFVFPTLGDPFGLVVEEAMACGLPVISSRSAGEITFRIDHGRSGLLVPPADVEALAVAMRQLAETPARRAQLAAAANEYVDRAIPAAYAKDFAEAVQQVIGQKR